jgi:hypothetical protein
MRLLYGFLCFAFLLSGCSATQVTPTPSEPPVTAPPTLPLPPIVPAKCTSGTWCTDYDMIIIRGLTPTMMASHPGDLCPNYDKTLVMKAYALSFSGAGAKELAMAQGAVDTKSTAAITMVDQGKFWARLVKAIALAESSWKIAPAPFLEPGMGIDPVTKLPVTSDGLMQLSYQDGKNYAKYPICKSIDYAKKNITIPEINLGCSLEIMHHLLDKYDGAVVTALGKYWSTVRTTTDGGKRMRAQLKKDMPECYQ